MHFKSVFLRSLGRLTGIFAVLLGPSESSSQSASGPVFGIASYIGGSGFESIRDIEADGEGNFYITGGTMSGDFPVRSGSDLTHNGGMDVMIVKFKPFATIPWATYLGGPSYDRAYAIETDRYGNVYVAGRAGAGFPVTEGAFLTEFQGGTPGGPYPAQDAFIAKLSPDGAVLWASYFGHSEQDIIRDIDVDAEGEIYVWASYDGVSRYPAQIRNRFLNQPAGDWDGVIARIASDGSEVRWARFIGGSDKDAGEGSIRLDPQGNPIALTTTLSADAPVTAGAYDDSHNGNWDFYVVKLSRDGAPVWSTYVGGSKVEHVETHELAVDATGNVYVVSGTTSDDFPTTPGAFQRTYGGSGGAGTGAQTNYQGDVVAAKLSPDGSTLLSSTYIGGSVGEAAEGVAVDNAGNVYMTGATYSADYPRGADAYQLQHRGGSDAFVTVLAADFSRLIYSTYYGGGGSDAGRDGAFDAVRNVFLFGGETSSADLRTVTPVSASLNGSADGIFGQLRMEGPMSVMETEGRKGDDALTVLEVQSDRMIVRISGDDPPSHGRFALFDFLGRTVLDAGERRLDSGEIVIPFQGAGVAPGTYLLRLHLKDGTYLDRIVGIGN